MSLTAFCTRCSRAKPADAFYPYHIHGGSGWCRSCLADYRRKNAERERLRTRLWKKRNPERAKQTSKRCAQRPKAVAKRRAWAKNNREKMRLYTSRWAKRNAAYRKALRFRRRRQSMIPPREMRALVTAVLAGDAHVCSYCGKGPLVGKDLTIDHIVPLTRGGRNERGNLCVACATCNSRKGKKTAEEFRKMLQIEY